MSSRVCVIDMPGLSRDLLSAIPANSTLGQWIASQRIAALTPCFPAVTCPMQATLTTGKSPAQHGIIANGLPNWRFPQDQRLVDHDAHVEYRKKISFWEQSNQFLDAPRFWQDSSGRSRYKTALLFFQNSMPGFVDPRRPAADIVLTPKPDHGPDGKLTSLIWSDPPELNAELTADLGPFPLMNYWGPMAGIASSQWIAKAAARVWNKHAPALQFTYIPHLDYDLQRFGPNSPAAIKAVADAAAALTPLVAAVLASGGKLVLLSEYAMQPVTAAVSPNRLLADAGLFLTRATPDGHRIDFEKSAAVAMVDHQVAYIYARDEAARENARGVLQKNELLTVADPAKLAVNHRRGGDLVVISAPHAWLDYRWWTNPADAPAFARTVDIHRKPGYDPLELFWDRAANGVSQDASLVKGSHGRGGEGEAVLVCDELAAGNLNATEVAGVIERMLA